MSTNAIERPACCVRLLWATAALAMLLGIASPVMAAFPAARAVTASLDRDVQALRAQVEGLSLAPDASDDTWNAAPLDVLGSGFEAELRTMQAVLASLQGGVDSFARESAARRDGRAVQIAKALLAQLRDVTVTIDSLARTVDAQMADRLRERLLREIDWIDGGVAAIETLDPHDDG